MQVVRYMPRPSPPKMKRQDDEETPMMFANRHEAANRLADALVAYKG